MSLLFYVPSDLLICMLFLMPNLYLIGSYVLAWVCFLFVYSIFLPKHLIKSGSIESLNTPEVYADLVFLEGYIFSQFHLHITFLKNASYITLLNKKNT